MGFRFNFQRWQLQYNCNLDAKGSLHDAGNILVKVHTVKASSACTREAARTDGVRKITKKFKEEIYSS